MLTILLMSALGAAFLIILAKKIGVIERLQVHGNKIVSSWASCDFCLSFWTNLALLLGVYLVLADPFVLVIAIPATPLTRFLV